MEIAQEVAALVSNVGFPIAAFVMMFWLSKTTLDECKNAIAENTLTIQKLIDKLEQE